MVASRALVGSIDGRVSDRLQRLRDLFPCWFGKCLAQSLCSSQCRYVDEKRETRRRGEV